MELFVLGTSHAVASGDVRERLHIDLDELFPLLRRFTSGRRVLDEAVPLATCGRLEIYGVARDLDRVVGLLHGLVCEQSGLSREEVEEHSYLLTGADAAQHLLEVASGLDSVVYGEAQILGQVRDALHYPEAEKTRGPLLHRLFESAIAAGKEVRTETEIGRGAASLAGAAITLLQREIDDLAAMRTVVLGAGDTGALVGKLLKKAGVESIVIANRSQARAREVAAKVGGEPAPLDDFPALLDAADLVVGAVAAPHRLMARSDLEGWKAAGTTLPAYFLDLAHPRNFDPDIQELGDVRLLDLENIQERIEAAQKARAAQVPRARAIAARHVEEYRGWLRSRAAVPVVKAVRQHVLETARLKAEAQARGLPKDEKEALRRFARSLARTILHEPTMALRDADPDSPQGQDLLRSASLLFGVAPRSADLDDDDAP